MPSHHQTRPQNSLRTQHQVRHLILPWHMHCWSWPGVSTQVNQCLHHGCWWGYGTPPWHIGLWKDQFIGTLALQWDYYVPSYDQLPSPPVLCKNHGISWKLCSDTYSRGSWQLTSLATTSYFTHLLSEREYLWVTSVCQALGVQAFKAFE